LKWTTVLELNHFSGDEVVYGYEFIRNYSGRISSKGLSYGSTSKDCGVLIVYRNNPAEMAVSVEAQVFHVPIKSKA